MGAWTLDTPYGKVRLFRNNPRTIREGQFDALCDSLEAHSEFMAAQPIVVWKVPERLDLAEGERCPFKGQEGELIVLSGNQRLKALREQGMTAVPEEWCRAARQGAEWWPWRDAEVFVNLANSPAGVSGDFDYKALQERFDEFRMRMAGIDFSNFTQAMAEGVMGKDSEAEAQEKAEGDPLMGEKSEELTAFIEEREKTRKALKYIDEFGFHLLAVFPMGFAQKAEFMAKAGLFGGRPVEAAPDPWMDFVFETSEQKADFIRAAGLDAEDGETGLPLMMNGMFCDGRVLARKMGIELKASGMHFRDRVIDGQLAEMAMEAMGQKSAEEIEEEVYAKVRGEREALGMVVAGGADAEEGLEDGVE